MEFHKNQVAWDAPDAGTVKLAKPDYSYLANSINSLSDAAEKVADYTQGVLDVDAKEKMGQAKSDALVKLSRHEPSDNNYGPAMEEFNTNIQNTMASFDEATRRRFLRDNPMFFDAARLRADEIVFKKQQEFAMAKTDEVIPLLASNVTEGITPYEAARKQLDNMVAQLPNHIANQKIRNFDTMVQETNLNNLIYNGRYQDALAFLENPKDSDMITPSKRTEKKLEIQKLMEQEAEAREKLKKQLKQDANDEIENGLTLTLLHALDKKDDSYVQLVKLLDDPESKVPLSDEEGNTVAYITAKDIPVLARRKAMKTAGTYEEDSMAYYVNAAKARELADNFEKQYMMAQGKRVSGEVFNNMYDFSQSPDFIYLKREDRDKILSMIYSQVNITNEQVVPYSQFREEDKMLYGVIRKREAPSPALAVRLITTGKTTEAEENKITSTLQKAQKTQGLVDEIKGLDEIADIWGGGTTLEPVERSNNIKSETRQRWFRQLTSELRDEYKKSTGREVLYGSELEYLMNTYAAVLAYTPNERAAIGVKGVTDEQVGLTYNRMLGWMERNGTTDVIIGQGMNKEQESKIRKDIFDSFLSTLNNNNTPELSDEQKKSKARLFDDLAIGTYGLGGAALSFTPTEASVYQPDIVYGKPLTNTRNQKIQKYQKGE